MTYTVIMIIFIVSGLDYVSFTQMRTFTTGDINQEVCVGITTSEDQIEESTEYLVVRFSTIHSSDIETKIFIADNDGTHCSTVIVMVCVI